MSDLAPCTCPYCPSPVDCAEWQASDEAKSLPTAADVQGHAAASSTWDRRNTPTGFVTERRSDNSTKWAKREN